MKNMQQVKRIGNTHDTQAITVLVFIIENELAAHQNRRGEWARATICGILSTPKMWSGLAFIVRKKQYFYTKIMIIEKGRPRSMTQNIMRRCQGMQEEKARQERVPKSMIFLLSLQPFTKPNLYQIGTGQ